MSESAHVGRESVIHALDDGKGGKRAWRVGRWTRDVWSRLLAWARGRLPDPLDVAKRMMAALPPASHPEIVKECVSRSTAYLSIGSPAVREVIESPEGTAYVLWLCLLQHHPDATEDDAWGIVIEMARDAVKAVLDKAAGKVPRAAEGKDPAPGA